MSLSSYNNFEKLKMEVRYLGIKSAHDYKVEVWTKHTLEWPVDPGLVYKDEWRSWKDFLG